MTELRDELKIGADEGPVDYVERAEAVLERHREETGERLTLWGEMPGERPGEVLARFEVLREVDGIRAAEWDRRHGQPTDQHTRQKKKNMLIFRTKSQEKDVERAVSAFEAEKKRLFRSDGSKVYGKEEHAERLGKLTDGFREKVEAVAEEAARDAEGYEREVLALSYQDPLKSLMTSERERVSASMPFVKEDFETQPLAALVERMRAVAAGMDKPSKLLHARYGLRRYEMETARLGEARLASQGQSTDGNPVGTTDTAALRELKTAAEEIAQELKDPADERGREAAQEAARKSQRIVTTSRSRLSQADGTAERVRREHAGVIQATF